MKNSSQQPDFTKRANKQQDAVVQTTVDHCIPAKDAAAALWLCTDNDEVQTVHLTKQMALVHCTPQLIQTMKQ